MNSTAVSQNVPPVVSVRQLQNDMWVLAIGDQQQTLHVGMLSALDENTLIQTAFQIRVAIAALDYYKFELEQNQKATKVRVMNQLREEKGMSKTEADSQAILDYDYQSVLRTLNSVNYQIEVLWAILKAVEAHLDLRKRTNGHE